MCLKTDKVKGVNMFSTVYIECIIDANLNAYCMAAHTALGQRESGVHTVQLS